jgi:hypothetical protein
VCSIPILNQLIFFVLLQHFIERIDARSGKMKMKRVHSPLIQKEKKRDSHSQRLAYAPAFLVKNKKNMTSSLELNFFLLFFSCLYQVS